MLTYKYRIKDSTSQNHLGRMAGAVNFVWNYCNEVSMLALRRNEKWLSAYDLHKLVGGSSTSPKLIKHAFKISLRSRQLGRLGQIRFCRKF